MRGIESKVPMKNITINLPEIYDENILKLIKQKLVPSRSEAVRTAIREFLHKEYENMELLGFFEKEKKTVDCTQPKDFANDPVISLSKSP